MTYGQDDICLHTPYVILRSFDSLFTCFRVRRKRGRYHRWGDCGDDASRSLWRWVNPKLEGGQGTDIRSPPGVRRASAGGSAQPRPGLGWTILF